MNKNELNENDLRRALANEGLRDEDISLAVYGVTDSTNQRAKEYAEKCNTPTPVVLIADCQSAGRGRLGRSFLSKGGAGIYMSLLVFPELMAHDAVRLTAYAAVAAARAIEALTPLKTGIKWVNDIYVGEKKLAGILTEGNVNPDGTLKYAVIGIGINTHKTDRGELAGIATDIESECGMRIDRARLAARIAKELLSRLDGLLDSSIVEEYRSRSMLIGRRVRVIKASEEYDALVTDITDTCELAVQREGATEVLSTGEVSLKIR